MQFEDIAFGYSRRRRPVLSAFNWAVPQGRTVLLGPNGAGKSTILSIAAGALRPWSGHCTIGGARSDRRREQAAYRKQVGWMPQTVRPVTGLRVREQVAYAAWLQGLGKAAAAEAALVALERVGLSDLADRRSRDLSGGQTRRMGLAEAIVRPRALLLLDEPTAGLDPAERRRFRTLVEEVSLDTNVVASTHEVEDLAGAYDTVVVLASGEILFSGSVQIFLAHAPTGSREPATDAYAQIIEGEERVAS